MRVGRPEAFSNNDLQRWRDTMIHDLFPMGFVAEILLAIDAVVRKGKPLNCIFRIPQKAGAMKEYFAFALPWHEIDGTATVMSQIQEIRRTRTVHAVDHKPHVITLDAKAWAHSAG